MPFTEVLLNSMAGLGLLFVGIKMVTRNLSAMTGDQLRKGIARASQHTWSAVLVGTLTGFVMQSGRTASFIMASFVQAGMISARRALPIVLWSNFGCTLVIFAAIFPIHLFALFLLAAAGACVAFERPKPMLNAASATFGLALMLLGLRMMSSSVELLSAHQAFMAGLTLIKSSLVLVFLAGLVVTFVAQSHTAIMLIAVAMASRGIFNFDQTIMAILGTHAGSSLTTFVTGPHFRGESRQVVIAQIFQNLVGVALFLLLFAVIKLAGGSLAEAARLADLQPATIATVAVIVVVALNFVTPLLLTLLHTPYLRLCARLSRPLPEEALSRPQFLHEELGESTITSLMLIEKEQLRLLRRLPLYCAALRDEEQDADQPGPEEYHAAFAHVAGAIDRTQGALMLREMSAEDTEMLLNQQKRQELIKALDEACFELWHSCHEIHAVLKPMCEGIVEALDTELLFAIDAASGDADARTMLDTMTRKRGAAMERVRKHYLSDSEGLTPDDRSAILHITSVFERAAWAMRRYGELLR